MFESFGTSSAALTALPLVGLILGHAALALLAGLPLRRAPD